MEYYTDTAQPRTVRLHGLAATSESPSCDHVACPSDWTLNHLCLHGVLGTYVAHLGSFHSFQFIFRGTSPHHLDRRFLLLRGVRDNWQRMRGSPPSACSSYPR